MFRFSLIERSAARLTLRVSTASWKGESICVVSSVRSALMKAWFSKSMGSSEDRIVSDFEELCWMVRLQECVSKR